MSNSPVVTRFAPSPTGFLHIGGARTALFNYLHARHHGGKFLLRIEDTDKERSTKEAVDAIFEGLNWLGLKPDAEPVFQSTRTDRHHAAVMELLAKGHAYRCYLTQDELADLREKARAQGEVVRSFWRDRMETREDLPHVIRFKGPLEGVTEFTDSVKGLVRFRNADLDDLVLLRSDGTPTYNLAVVVDDHDMGITHIIRGDDHLNNAARQIVIYQAFGWAVPSMAHIPLIHGPDGAKLSKRHGAQAVGEFADMGYLPKTVRNYLARLGWGHGDAEIFSDEDAIKWFLIEDVVQSPARLDWAKLDFLNAHYLKTADLEDLATLVVQSLLRQGITPDQAWLERLPILIGLLREGAKTIPDLLKALQFTLQKRPLTLTEKTQSLLNEETGARLKRLAEKLKPLEFQREPLEAAIRAFAEEEGVGIGKFGPALRGILAGEASAPDLATTLTALGSEESLKRIEDGLVKRT